MSAALVQHLSDFWDRFSSIRKDRTLEAEKEQWALLQTMNDLIGLIPKEGYAVNVSTPDES
jgi:hypothetical protein